MSTSFGAMLVVGLDWPVVECFMFVHVCAYTNYTASVYSTAGYYH